MYSLSKKEKKKKRKERKKGRKESAMISPMVEISNLFSS
jgi:hypothetical protein